METTTIIKRAKILNYVEIVITMVMFIMFKIISTVSTGVTTTEELNKLISIERAGLWIMGIASVVVIVLTALMMKENKKRVKGLGCLLASGIITLVFSILGITLGIVIWILAGISLKALKQKGAEDSFEAQLKVEITADNTDEAAETVETAEAIENLEAAEADDTIATEENEEI